MKNIYKNLYGDDTNSGNLGSTLRIKIMLEMANNLQLTNKNILDIGCHNGIFLSLIKNRNNNFYGLDANDWAVSESEKKDLNIRQFFFDDKTKLPFENEFFDVVIAGEIIEHIFDTDFFLEEISRVMKPGGKLLISTPNVASLGRRLLLFFGANPIIELSPNEANSVGHIRYFTRKTLEKILAKHGLKTTSFHSDCIIFSRNGKLKSEILAKVFPKLGSSIICLSEKIL
jgi:2-polyprenyl-3-methyl-5-hydroxy-6-metoxy-1,4-benzoquinol methylase